MLHSQKIGLRNLNRLFKVCALGIAVATPAEAQAGNVFAYSTRSDNQVHLISADDLAPISKIDAQMGAHELAFSPDGTWLVGSAYGGPGRGHQPADKRLVVINAKSQTVHRIVDLGEMQRPNDIAFLAGGPEAIVTVESPPCLIKLNVDSGEFTKITIDRPANHMLALNPAGKKAYVAHVMPGGVSVIDLETGTTKSMIDVPTGAEGIACSPDGKAVWVACNRSDSISVIDTTTNSVTKTIEAKGFPFRLRFSPDGARVAVSFPAASEIGIFDVNNPDQPHRVNLRRAEDAEAPVQCTSIAFSPDGKAIVAVCDGRSPELVRIDVGTRTVTHRVAAAGKIPDALASGRLR